MFIGPHTGEDDEVLLSALEGIDTGHLQLLREGEGEGEREGEGGRGRRRKRRRRRREGREGEGGREGERKGERERGREGGREGGRERGRRGKKERGRRYCTHVYTCKCKISKSSRLATRGKMDRQTDRKTNRQKDRPSERQTVRQTDCQTDRLSDRQTVRQMDSTPIHQYLVQSLQHGAIVLHVLDHVRPLTLVGGDDPDLVWTDAGLHQLGHHLLHVHRLHPVRGEE